MRKNQFRERRVRNKGDLKMKLLKQLGENRRGLSWRGSWERKKIGIGGGKMS